MSYKGYRIKTRVNGEDTLLSVNLKQGVKTLDILSLQINPEDAYQVHTSDYGVIVGRVLANNAFGVPNVKVSVFVPISREDEDDYVISNEYPFKTTQSRDNNGVRYNLIPEVEGGIGTFPNKRMVLDNDGTVEVFGKYWKFTTTTNQAGDYMIFGVPTGSCQTHYDCDLSDIGILSQKPYDLIEKGYDENLFKSKTKFTDTNLASAVHILSQDKTVYVYPFWGDSDANKIGITRNDINLDYEFTPSCVFMGGSITDSHGTYIGTSGMPNGGNGRFASLVTSVGDIEVIRKREDGTVEELKDNVKSIIDGNGVWCYRIPMNLDRIGTDEYGNIVAVNDPSRGIPTRARVRMRISLTDAMDTSTGEYTAKMLVPCNPKLKHSEPNGTSGMTADPIIDDEYVSEEDWENFYEFGSKTPDCCFRDLYWGKVYSVKQYYPRFQYEYWLRDVEYKQKDDDKSRGTYYPEERMYDFSGYPIPFAVPFSAISSIDTINGLNTFPYTTMYSALEEHIDYKTRGWFEFHLTEHAGSSSLTSKGLHFCFENDWINGCLYFPRVMIQRISSNNYDYFGALNDNDPENGKYKYMYITGRHNCAFRDNAITSVKTADANPRWWDKHYSDTWYTDEADKVTASHMNNVSIFSHVSLYNGIITRKVTSIGQSVFYYKCGCVENSSDTTGDNVVYKRLYTTDLILLGNLDDIYDNLPRLFEKIPSTSATFPPVVIPNSLNEAGMNRTCYSKQCSQSDEFDTDKLDIFNNTEEAITGVPRGYSPETDGTIYSKALFDDVKPTINENLPEPQYGEALLTSLMERTFLFFGLKIRRVLDCLIYAKKTFVNMSRICELDVHNDSAFYQPDGTLVPINGIIDKYDIYSDENRSLFATMNYDFNKYIIDSNTGHRMYAPTPIYVCDFDGRLEEYASSLMSNYAADVCDPSYTLFRYGWHKAMMGKGPFVQTNANMDGYRVVIPYEIKTDFHTEIIYITIGEDVSNYSNGPIILPENSFFFYFGLRSGMSAIDKMRERYCDKVEESIEVVHGLRCTVDPSDIECVGGVEVGKCSVNFVGMTYPVSYYLYYKNTPHTKGVVNSESENPLGLDKLYTGVYKIEAVDASGTEEEAYFSILKHGIQSVYEAYIDDYSNKPCLKISSIGSYEVNSVLQDTAPNKVIVTNGNYESYTFEFSEMCSVNMDGIILFNSSVNSVDAHVVYSTYNCVYTDYNISFEVSTPLEPNINGVSTGYLTQWSDPSVSPGVASSDADRVFQGDNFFIFDSIRAAYVEANKYNLNNLGVRPYNEQLNCISCMCQAVYGNGKCVLGTGTLNSNYRPVAIYPNLKQYNELYEPSRYWRDGVSGDTLQVASTDGFVNSDGEVPYIVGSNFPVSAETKTFLKHSVSEIYGTSTYVSNETVSSNDTGGCFGVNLIGIRHTEHTDVEQPRGGLSPSVPLSGTSYGSFDMGAVSNYFGFRNVDKRLDYQFVIKTPMTLCSGYSRYPNLTKKSLFDGDFRIDVYGGARFRYDDETKSILDYVQGADGKISGGPSSSGKLYTAKIYEDGDWSHPIDFKETVDKVWQDDIDHVVWETDTKRLQSGSTLTMDITGCSFDFTGGYVKPGDSLSLNLSYQSGINVMRGDLQSYDVIYHVKGYESSAYTEYFASFSGTSLMFKVDTDPTFNGTTYTDLFTTGKHNGETTEELEDNFSYPDWARLYEDDVAYSGRSSELSIILCEPVIDNGVTTYQMVGEDPEYTVHFETIANTLPEDPRYSGDTSIASFYPENGEKVYLNDREANQYIQFEIDYADKEKMQAEMPRWGFLLIPTRRVYATGGTSLKQGVEYNVGHPYYASSIWVSADKEKKTASIYLNTPLRRNRDGSPMDYSSPTFGISGLTATYIDYNATSLVDGDMIHTIGEVENYWCNGADVKYNRSEMRFDVSVIDSSVSAAVFFNISNGLRYKVLIMFGDEEE